MIKFKYIPSSLKWAIIWHKHLAVNSETTISKVLFALPCCDPRANGQLQRDVLRQVLEVVDVSLLPLLQHPDLLTLPAQLGSLLCEEGWRASAWLPHHAPDFAPFTLKSNIECWLLGW